jgi:hypothetical protein
MNDLYSSHPMGRPLRQFGPIDENRMPREGRIAKPPVPVNGSRNRLACLDGKRGNLWWQLGCSNQLRMLETIWPTA